MTDPPTWESPDIPGYLFLGGLAGAGALLGAGAHVTGRRALARTSKVGVLGAALLSLVGLVHDLGRPARFLHMLRVLKVTSPMSVGSWLLAGFVPLAGASAASAVTGRLPRIGAAATAGAAAIGPAVASYTAALVADTAVPAWHDGYREMPFVFVGSAASAAGGWGMTTAPLPEQGAARAMAVLGAALQLAAFERMERRLGMVAEPYSSGRGRLRASGQGVVSGGHRGGAAGSARPCRLRARGRCAGSGFRRYQMVDLPRRDAVRPGSALHRCAATGTAGAR